MLFIRLSGEREEIEVESTVWEFFPFLPSSCCDLWQCLCHSTSDIYRRTKICEAFDTEQIMKEISNLFCCERSLRREFLSWARQSGCCWTFPVKQPKRCSIEVSQDMKIPTRLFHNQQEEALEKKLFLGVKLKKWGWMRWGKMYVKWVTKHDKDPAYVISFSHPDTRAQLSSWILRENFSCSSLRCHQICISHHV